jgi:Iap family predicted aminopeptidase
MKSKELIFMLIRFLDDNNLESRFIDFCIENGEEQEDVEEAIDEFKDSAFDN